MKVVKPWGYYEVLAESSETAPYWKLKKIVLAPGQSISLQAHALKDEIWKITKGSGQLINGAAGTHWSVTERTLDTSDYNSTTVIKAGDLHRITAGPEGVEFLELATSKYPVREDDITRYQDQYGRV